jgi:hypothetical protein
LSQKFDTKNCFTNFENKCFLFYTTKKLTLIDPCLNLLFLKILSEISFSLLLSLLQLALNLSIKVLNDCEELVVSFKIDNKNFKIKHFIL